MEMTRKENNENYIKKKRKRYSKGIENRDTDNEIYIEEKIDIKDENTSSTSNEEDFIQEINKIRIIFSKKYKEKRDRTLVNDFLKRIPEKINNYNEDNKINLILDIDNTLIYSTPYSNLPGNKFILIKFLKSISN